MATQTELQNWFNGTATGGPNGDGTYPLTTKDGTVHYVYCPAAQALNPTLPIHPVDIYHGEALTARDEAQTAATNAATSATNAANSAAAANTSASNAATSATNANNSATAASGSASTASTKASEANTSATNAASAKTAAEGARDKALLWADAAENTTVETGKYSAKHWAAKAAASAASIDTSNFATANHTHADKLPAQGPTVTAGYFSIKPYNASYDDGSRVESYYSGNARKWYFYGRDSANVVVDLGFDLRGLLTAKGATFSENVTIAAGKNLLFAASTGSKVKLYESGAVRYEIGVQNYTHYFRTGSTADGFAWHFGGVHDDARESAGAGGTLGMTLRNGLLTLPGKFVGNALDITNANGTLTHFNWNGTSVNYIRGATEFSAAINVTGDITASRGNATGVIYLGNTGSRYLFFDGSAYVMPGAHLWVNGTPVKLQNENWLSIPDTRSTMLQPNQYAGQRSGWEFKDNASSGAGGVSWHALLTVCPWSEFNVAHPQQQLVFRGNGLSYRAATSATTWGAYKHLVTSPQQNTEIYVQTTDPGAVGAGRVWFKPV